MPHLAGTPKVAPGGLITVAYLKAQLDHKNDHIGMFMPLVTDVLAHIQDDGLTSARVKEELFSEHGIAMPEHVVSTLLKRAVGARTLRREAGRYFKIAGVIPPSEVRAAKKELELAQDRLAKALQAHAAKRGLTVPSEDDSMDMLMRFLEAEKVGMLLRSWFPTIEEADPSQKEASIVAEFIQDVVQESPQLLSTLQRMIEGLVLYHAAFLPDLATASQKFKNLRVIFDSSLIRHALGYEGDAMQSLMTETLSILKGAGVQCFVFENTVEEIRRILAMYGQKLGTTYGQQSLRPVPMARHFLTQRYKPSDVLQMSVLLEKDIVSAGFQISKLPSRKPEFTLGEKELAGRLASPGASPDEIEPRVAHDVDCIAGILQLRAGSQTTRLEEARAVFAADSPLMIRNMRLWWEDDEHRKGIEPVVHIRALTNLAWLKDPSRNATFKIKELTALCSVALRPSQETWKQFLKHLESLRMSNRLSSDEISSILVSAMSDNLLREAESGGEISEDFDSATLDEVVERVKSTYMQDADAKIDTLRTEFEGKIQELSSKYERTLQAANERLSMSVEAETRQRVVIQNRCLSWARAGRITSQFVANAIVLVGAFNILRAHPMENTWTGKLTLFTVVCFVALEVIGLGSHMSARFNHLEKWAADRMLQWLTAKKQELSN